MTDSLLIIANKGQIYGLHCSQSSEREGTFLSHQVPSGSTSAWTRLLLSASTASGKQTRLPGLVPP